jgi:AraC-like DNA-binding protein
MSEHGSYGQRLGNRFKQEDTRAIVTRTLRKTEIAVTEIRGDNPEPFMSGSLPREDAFLVGQMVRDYPHHEYWEEGRQAPITDLRAGDAVLYDLKRDPVALINKPFHALAFYLSRAALNAIADDAGMRVVARPIHGGLAPWQERRAKELLSANLDGNVSLTEVARECGLSISHFSRAFRQSTGMAPHRWLIQRRVEAAKELLRDASSLTLLDIALRCGFANQSHFTRTFAGVVGSSPGSWRRQVRQ